MYVCVLPSTGLTSENVFGSFLVCVFFFSLREKRKEKENLGRTAFLLYVT